MSSKGGERLTERGEALALQAGVVAGITLRADFNRREGKRKFQVQLVACPLFAELRGAAEKKNVLQLAVELLKFYEQSLAISVARKETERTGRVQNTQEFWSAQQEIKRTLLGSKYEEKKFLGIFVGLDFLAGQKVRDLNELDLERLRASIREQVKKLSPENPRKDLMCSTQTAQI